MKSRNWWIGVTAGTVLGLGGVLVAEQATTEARAQSFSVTPGQLQINQRISQAAVRRSNESPEPARPRPRVRRPGRRPRVGHRRRSATAPSRAPSSTPPCARASRAGPSWPRPRGALDARTRARPRAAKLADPGLYTRHLRPRSSAPARCRPRSAAAAPRR